MVALVGLLWFAASASWGRNGDSPWLVVSGLVLPVLALFFTLRLDVGLALVALSAPFYLHTGEMLYGALSLPEVLVVLCGIATLVRSRRGNRKTKRRGARLDWLDRCVIVLLLAAVVAGLAAADRGAALWELRAVFLLPALYYALLRLASLDGRTRWRIADGWVAGAAAVALVGLAQYAMGRNVVIAEGGVPRLQSVYYSPNNVGLYLERVWPLLVSAVLWSRYGRRRVFYTLALVPVTLALGLSFSRGALLLGLPAAILAIGWRAGGRVRWAALALVLASALALVPILQWPRFAAMFDLQQGSTFFRLELWRSSLTLIHEHPWLGVGPGNFLAAYRTRYILPRAWSEPNLEHPHNVYLDHWTRLGILGVLAGIATQVAFWRTLSRRSDPASPPELRSETLHQPGTSNAPAGHAAGRSALSLGLAGSMAAVLAHGLVDNTLFFPDLALVFFLTLALAQAQADDRSKTT